MVLSLNEHPSRPLCDHKILMRSPAKNTHHRNKTKVTHTAVLVDLNLKTSRNFCHLPSYLGNIFCPITERQVKRMERPIAIHL